jgi:hypothetical protein
MLRKIKISTWYKIKRFLSKRRKYQLRKAKKGLKENQSKIIDIANYLVSNPESKLMHSVISGTFFIEYREIICRIESDRIVVTNGMYSYDISTPLEVNFDLSKRFLNHLESRRRAVEKKINNKLSSSLSRVHEQIIFTR